MTSERLNILWVSQMPASPPRFGAQARVHGLMTHVARSHDITAVALVDPEFDTGDCYRAMRDYCRDVVLLPNWTGRGGTFKRVLQLRSLASLQSFERYRLAVAPLRRVLRSTLTSKRFDVVNLEFPYLAHLGLRQAPVGLSAPPLVLDTHEIAYDLARQLAERDGSLSRKIYGGINWRKLRREERAAFATADGICACSAADEARVLAEAPSARTVVIPNAADVDFYQPRSGDPAPDGRTVVYFGLLSTVPNIDAVRFFVREIWPRIAAEQPQARCKIIGTGASPALLELGGPSVEFTGFVDDLRPHLASAAVICVPLRLGGGTRLKIVEGMAMGRPIVSTTLGAEGIEAAPGREILIADDPQGFAAAVNRLLSDADLGKKLGESARKLAVERYSWSAAARTLERFYREVIDDREQRRQHRTDGRARV